MANAQHRRPYIPTWFIPRSYDENNGTQQGFPVWAWNPYTGKGPSLPPVGSLGFPTGQGTNPPSHGQGGNPPPREQEPNPPSCGQGRISPPCGQGRISPTFGQEPNRPSYGQGRISPTFGQEPNPPSYRQGRISPPCGQGRISPTFGQEPNPPSYRQGRISPLFGQGSNPPSYRQGRISPPCGQGRISPTFGQEPNPQSYRGGNTNINGAMGTGDGYPTMGSSGYLSDRGNTNTNEANRRLTETIDCRSHINEHDVHNFILENQSKLTDENKLLLQSIYKLLGTQPYFVWHNASIEVFGDQMTVMFTSGCMNNKFVICRSEDEKVISRCKERSFRLSLRIGAIAVYNGFSRVCKAVLGAVGSAGKAMAA